MTIIIFVVILPLLLLEVVVYILNSIFTIFPEVLQLPSVNATENKTSVDLQWAIDCPYTVPGNYSIFFNGTTIE